MAAGRNALSPSFFSLTPCPSPRSLTPVPLSKGRGE